MRLYGRDYGANGSYLVTVCTDARKCSLSRIAKDGVHLSKFGKIIEEEWRQTLQKRPYLQSCEFVVMPNHIHALLTIVRDSPRLGEGKRGLFLEFGAPLSGALPQIVGSFKSAITKRVNELRGSPGAKFWQRSYYEHVVQDDEDFEEIAHYVRCNPDTWVRDRENQEGSPDAAEERFWEFRLRLRT